MKSCDCKINHIANKHSKLCYCSTRHFRTGLPWATAPSAPCSAEPARWPPLPLEWSSVCALSSSAASPCRPHCSPVGSHPAEASAPWSSYSTERGRDDAGWAHDFTVWASTVGINWTVVVYSDLRINCLPLNKARSPEKVFIFIFILMIGTKLSVRWLQLHPSVFFCDAFRGIFIQMFTYKHILPWAMNNMATRATP